MSSRKRREKNRNTAAGLDVAIWQAANDAHTCENCGAPGFHWIVSMGSFIGFGESTGFWTCPKYYDPITKRRIGT